MDEGKSRKGKRMNGEWRDTKKELPEKGITVLAVKQLKNGTMDYCLAKCIQNYRYYDTAKRELIDGPYWTCGGNNNVILWMPLPEIPGKGN